MGELDKSKRNEIEEECMYGGYTHTQTLVHVCAHIYDVGSDVWGGELPRSPEL